MRASDTSEVLFEDCRVPADQLLGDEGQGFVNTMQVLDAGRIGIAALAVGLAQGAYEAALRYAQERKAFGKPIAEFQAIQWKLADIATRIEAARLLTYRAAYLKDRGERTTLESSMAKLYASEIAVQAADDCVQIHGGYGFVKDYPAEKFFRDVKLTHDRRGHERDPAARHRPPAAVARDDRRRVDRRWPSACSAGDPRAIARAISLIEDEDAGRRRRSSAPIFAHTGRAYLIGVTGPPGAGKSTLVDRLTAELRRRRPRRSACIAVDPDEPVQRRRRFSAIACACRRTPPTPACSSAAWRRAAISAAWRARPATPRSCSTPPATTSSSSRPSASARTRSTSSAPPTSRSSTLVPGTGDDVQALKAGIMEIADIFVVNKADREGADRLVVVGRGDPVAATPTRPASGGRRS